MSLFQKVKVWLKKKLAVKTSHFSIIDLLQQRDFKLSSSVGLEEHRLRSKWAASPLDDVAPQLGREQYYIITDAKVSTCIVCFYNIITGFLLDNEFKWNKISFVL